MINSEASPYWKDIVDILFAPNGYEYSSRYQWKWIADDMGTLRGIKGKRALLVFRGESNNLDYYLPLREATISEVSDHGPFVVVHYRLGRFVDLGHQSHAFADGFDRDLQRYMDKMSIPSGKAGTLVFQVAGLQISFSTKEEDDDHNWANMVDEVVRSAVFTHSVFLRFNGLVDEQSERTEAIRDGRFLLRSGKVYFINVVQYVPEKDGEGRPIDRAEAIDLGMLEMETIDIHVNVLVEEAELLGRYDDHTFFFVCQKLNDRTISRIGLLGKGKDEFYVPSLIFQLAIAPQRRVLLGYSGFFMGLLIIGISTILPGAELILAAAGSVISTAGLLMLER